jgi:purine-binding chemotaxis protein CheW
MTEQAQVSTAQRAGKYLTFKLRKEEYGLEILKVQEIIGMMNVTRVPKMPGYVRGVINLRGKVIPVVDLRLKFGLDHQDDTERTCIIVVQIDGGEHEVTIGIIVDEVSEVLDVAEDQIEDPPSFGGAVDTAFILAMGKIGDKVIMFLDIDKVLSVDEMKTVGAVAGD